MSQPMMVITEAKTLSLLCQEMNMLEPKTLDLAKKLELIEQRSLSLARYVVWLKDVGEMSDSSDAPLTTVADVHQIAAGMTSCILSMIDITLLMHMAYTHKLPMPDLTGRVLAFGSSFLVSTIDGALRERETDNILFPIFSTANLGVPAVDFEDGQAVRMTYMLYSEEILPRYRLHAAFSADGAFFPVASPL